MLGANADDLFGDPRHWHPVAGFGVAAAPLEDRPYADNRSAGIRFATAAALPALVTSIAAHRASRHRPALQVALIAAATWAVLGGRNLRSIGSAVAAGLADAVADHTDTDAIERLITEGIPAGPSFIASEANGGRA